MSLRWVRVMAASKRLAMRLSPQGRKELAHRRRHIDDDTTKPGFVAPDREGSISSSLRNSSGESVGVHWYEYGPEDAEETVVYIHGFTLAAEAFFRQIDSLQKTHPHLNHLAMDLRGHGKTGAVASTLCTIDGAADDVAAVLRERATTGPLILVGHSLGGMVVFNLVRRYQELLHKRIAGIVIVDSAIDALGDEGTAQFLTTPIGRAVYRAAVKDPEAAEKIRDDIDELLAPALAIGVFHREGVDFDIVEFHASMIHNTPLATLTGFFDDLAHHDERAAAPLLAGIAGRVLVGEKDDVTPVSQAEKILELWPDAVLTVAADVGHMLILEDPETCTKAIADLIDEEKPADVEDW